MMMIGVQEPGRAIGRFWTLLGDAGVHMVGTDLAQLGALGAILVACFFDTLDVR